jgi:hypothetical protein
MTKIVNIGDGRFIEMPKEGPKASPKAKPKTKPKTAPRKKSETSAKTHKVKKRTLHHTPAGREPPPEIPGHAEWVAMRKAQMGPFQTNAFRALIGLPPKTRLGVPDGMRVEEAQEAWRRAKELATKDIENMKATGVLDPNDARAEEAMEATLEVMRGPMNQQTKLAAARQVLEWTKAKPAAKTEMTVNAAEAWLSEIAKEAEEGNA